MKLLLLARILSLSILSLSIFGAAIARADDCASKLTDQEKQTYGSLTPANQQIMAKMKMKNGSPGSCDFRAGLLDMLGNFPPQDRDASFQQLLDKTFVKQN
jgi:hypothetical protein